MGRTTIDFGIDLGTTNSVIACVQKGELVIIKNSITNSEATPSVVYLDGRGSLSVGDDAYGRLEYDADNAVGEFKRWIGNQSRDGFLFKACGRRMTAAELSAEVLKSLKADAASRFGEEIRAAVVTVPAMFLLPACEETQQAARLAGIEISPLLQEPVAAAMAYGYQAETLSGHLLVFDLGGGTFDTTILAAKNGRLVVVGHDGDDKLGGKDYDWALVALIQARLREEYPNVEFQRGSRESSQVFAWLKYRAEQAKKALSARENISIPITNLKGKAACIDTTIELTRSDLEGATSGLTSRCLEISRRLMAKCRLNASDLQAVVLVGGQTRAPYIRQAVENTLGKAEFRLDPMTVVAAGAALFASTQRLPQQVVPTVRHEFIGLKLAYNPVSAESDADVGLVFDQVPNGATVILTRADKGWTSGAVPIPKSGKMVVTVVLRTKKANVFDIEVRDQRGAQLHTTEASFTITHGLAVAQATTSRAFSVALERNDVEILIPNGAPLPAKATKTFASAHEVLAGDADSILYVHVLEGDNARADRNFGVGKVVLEGAALKRTLPAGSAVEVTYKLNESRVLSVDVVFPLLREARSAAWNHERPAFTPTDIDNEVRREKERLAEIKEAAPDIDTGEADEQLTLLHHQREAAASDADAAQVAAQAIIEVKQKVDALSKATRFQQAAKTWNEYREPTIAIVEAIGSDDQKKSLATILAHGDSALSARNEAAMVAAAKALEDLYWQARFSQHEFWLREFSRLSESQGFVDPIKAERLIEEGTRAVKRNDIKTLRTIVIDLYRLTPSWQSGPIDMRFANAGLKRAQGQGS